VTKLIHALSHLRFLLAYGYNQPYPYGSGQGISYGGLGASSGFPYSNQGNYNGYYPIGAVNPYQYGRNVGGLRRSGVGNPRTGGNIGEPSPVERTQRSASLSYNPTNK